MPDRERAPTIDRLSAAAAKVRELDDPVASSRSDDNAACGPLAAAWRIANAMGGEAGEIMREALRAAVDAETGRASLRRRNRDAIIREIARWHFGDAVGPSAAAARLVDAWGDYASRVWPRERDGSPPMDGTLRAELWGLCSVAPEPLSTRQVATILANGNFTPWKLPSVPADGEA